LAEAPGLLRVAAAQAASVSGDVETNVVTAVALVEQAAGQGARVVVLPELFLTGYDPAGWSEGTTIHDLGDARLEPLCRVSEDREVIVVVGAARAAPPGVRLSLLVFGGGQARAQHVYDKQHLTDEERAFFTPGDHGASILVDGWQLGLGVCFDGCFPEHAAAAATDGAMAYLCPSAYYVGSEHRRDLYYAARALDNGIYVVFAGLTGTCGGYAFNGGSAVYDPEGRPVVRTDASAPAAVVADLDPAEVRRVQAMNPILRDRRRSLGPRRTFPIAEIVQS
jgi:predicted amidohydrolase